MTALIVVIAVNVVVSLFGFRDHSERFLFIPHQVAHGENRVGMLLAHFAHAGPAHLAFNMLALYSFAGTVLAVLGSAKFLLIYVVAGLGADAVIYALHKNDPAYRCLGASGRCSAS